MKNIFILGNGFDLAHGYATDYASFIKWMVDKCISDGEFENELFNIRNYNDGINGESGYTGKVKNSYKETIITDKYTVWLEIKSELVVLILRDLNCKKWCDIEALYYQLLEATNSPKDLNGDLNFLKLKLQEYLLKFNSNKQLESFVQFFSNISSHNDLILNFNYTDTFKRLYGENFTGDIVDIHGQLENKLNPIIFGYAPTEEKNQNLIDKNDNEYLKNIKRYFYKQTKSENILYEFLGDKNERDEINVFIIGHSCGVSDRKILKDIFTNDNILNINIVYYKDYNGYFDTLVNIDRIIGRESNYGTIRSIELSLACPQIDDDAKIKKNFTEKILNIKRDIDNSSNIPSFHWV